MKEQYRQTSTACPAHVLELRGGTPSYAPNPVSILPAVFSCIQHVRSCSTCTGQAALRYCTGECVCAGITGCCAWRSAQPPRTNTAAYCRRPSPARSQSGASAPRNRSWGCKRRCFAKIQSIRAATNRGTPTHHACRLPLGGSRACIAKRTLKPDERGRAKQPHVVVKRCRQRLLTAWLGRSHAVIDRRCRRERRSAIASANKTRRFH